MRDLFLNGRSDPIQCVAKPQQQRCTVCHKVCYDDSFVEEGETSETLDDDAIVACEFCGRLMCEDCLEDHVDNAACSPKLQRDLEQQRVVGYNNKLFHRV